MTKQVSLLLFLSFVSACGGLSDATIDLGSGYFYVGESATSNTIVYRQSPQYLRSSESDKTIVYPNVLKYAYDNKFIIVSQGPDYASNIDLIMLEGGFGVFYNEEERIANEMKADSVLKNSPFFKKMFSQKHNYYVIDKSTHKTYGPFNEIMFQNFKKKLGISLVLRE